MDIATRYKNAANLIVLFVVLFATVQSSQAAPLQQNGVCPDHLTAVQPPVGTYPGSTALCAPPEHIPEIVDANVCGQAMRWNNQIVGGDLGVLTIAPPNDMTFPTNRARVRFAVEVRNRLFPGRPDNLAIAIRAYNADGGLTASDIIHTYDYPSQDNGLGEWFMIEEWYWMVQGGYITIETETLAALYGSVSIANMSISGGDLPDPCPIDGVPWPDPEPTPLPTSTPWPTSEYTPWPTQPPPNTSTPTQTPTGTLPPSSTPSTTPSTTPSPVPGSTNTPWPTAPPATASPQPTQTPQVLTTRQIDLPTAIPPISIPGVNFPAPTFPEVNLPMPSLPTIGSYSYSLSLTPIAIGTPNIGSVAPITSSLTLSPVLISAVQLDPIAPASIPTLMAGGGVTSSGTISQSIDFSTRTAETYIIVTRWHTVTTGALSTIITGSTGITTTEATADLLVENLTTPVRYVKATRYILPNLWGFVLFLIACVAWITFITAAEFVVANAAKIIEIIRRLIELIPGF